MLFSVLREIGPRFVIGHLLALLLTLTLGVFAFVRSSHIADTVNHLTNELAVERALADDIVSQVALVRFHASTFARTHKQTDLDRFEETFARLQTLLSESERTMTGAEEISRLRLIRQAVGEYRDKFDEATQLIHNQQEIRSEQLDVQALTIANKLAALRVSVDTTNNTAAFLAIGNAQSAFQQMQLNTVRYLQEEDERYNVLFETDYRQAQTSLSALQNFLPNPNQQRIAADAAVAVAAYAEGFYAARENAMRLRTLFDTDLARLEILISGTATQIADDVAHEFQRQNEAMQALIAQTRLMLLGAAILAVLATTNMSLTTYRHIVRRLQAEESLRRHRDHLEEVVQARTAELQQSNEEIKQFAYIVSHDLRAPLVNLKGFAAELRYSLEVLQSAMEATLPHLSDRQREAVTFALQEDIPEALGFIEASVSRTDRFLSALLRLSRLGRARLQFEPVDVNEVVQSTLQSLAHQIDQQHIRVTVDPLPVVMADRTAMEQIFGNLLDNAVKYLDSSRPGEITITAHTGETETTFHVRDNGRGIPPEHMDRVFAPFRRAGRQDRPGEGMGLAYVQTLVRRHGGRIECQSQLGEGTTFTFTIARHLPTRSETETGKQTGDQNDHSEENTP